MNRLQSLAPATRAALITVGLAATLSLWACLSVGIALVGLGQWRPDLEWPQVPAWFWYYRFDADVRRWLGIGTAVAGLILCALGAAAFVARRRPLHGAARWASDAETTRAGLRARSGVLLGRTGGDFLIADGPDHIMLYAPTRTGKGVGVVIPNLLAWPDAVVVLDIKRENFLATAGYRARAGQAVHLFDPLAPDGETSRFNPLGHVDRNDDYAVLDELQRMAAMIFPGSDHADPFWSEAARTGFIGVGGYVAATPDLPFTLGEIFRQLTASKPQSRWETILADRASGAHPLPAAAAAAIRDFIAASENTFSSVRQSITTRMGLWLNDRVDAATSTSDFDLRTLREGRLSLYLGATPDNLLRVQPLYALLFQQLIDLNSRSLPGPEDRPVLVILDEFARLGAAPVLAHGFSWVAGYGLRLLAVLQSPAQLRATYGPELTEDILSNCGIEIVFAPRALKVAQELSDRLGYYTTPGRSRSSPVGLGRGRRSTTVSDQRRALMLPQELMQLPSDALIVLKAGSLPVRGRKIVYWRERAFKRRLRPPPPVLRSHPTPLFPLRAEGSPPPLGPNAVEADPMDFDLIAQAFVRDGLAPPAIGASEAEVSAWLDRVVDDSLAERCP
ncbi:type IV secretory system conjugative DNA transfer family protein [Brevundimonas nasdae]|uniref:Type IV secretory system conjugative DNA transfer family protein n=1 Tax=Brevundimonas nasdae TaxID=172043 RepID=A0ABX8TKZ7_9CAUL|nr:type IV secretory system conjugative DNA transfer family protein [Brevundimonas nasdae]QYC11463.1 type IV secretory system conjugative DNA transfer family protein [Brevundimonas nasdae]QYC14251.1 type IV secretory system conjugative DNA transfer family protein [Brevundimonas nasdae]